MTDNNSDRVEASTRTDGRQLIETVRNSLGPRRSWLPLVIVLGVLAAAFEGLGVGLIIPALATIIGGEQATGTAGEFFGSIGAGMVEGSRLALIAGLIVLLVIFKNLFAYANAVLVGFLYGHAGHRTRSQLAHRILSVDYSFILGERPGRLLNVLSNESWRCSDSVQVVLKLIVALTASVTFAIFLMLISWQMTLLVIVGIAAIQVVHHAWSSKLKRFSRELAGSNKDMASGMLHVVHAGRLVRMFEQEEAEMRAFDCQSDAVRSAALSLERRQAALPAFTEVAHVVLFFGVIITAWSLGYGFPLIAAFVILLYRLQPHVREIQSGWSQLHGWSGSLDEVDWLLRDGSRHRTPEGNAPFEGLSDEIRFEKVDFSYPGADRKVLRSLDLTIERGKATALVGRSGCGKSTVVSLLCRFLTPNAGSITVDGTDIQQIPTQTWRDKVALASQDLELAEGTVADNIAYGRPNASQDRIERAARMAEAHEFITALPDGYDTWIGYRGAFVSAGQRQRIALARALLREPEILILDEATNALDGLSEAAIIETLRMRRGHSTTIVISHHRSTLEFCDEVFELLEVTSVQSPEREQAQRTSTLAYINKAAS